MEHTIAAIATSTMSSGGISVIRLSGEDAVEIADKIFKSVKGIKLTDVASHTVHYGHIVSNEKVIDEVASEILEAAASAKDCVKWFDKSVRIVFRWTFDVNL